MTEIYNKPSLTFEQQIEKLISRGLNVSERNRSIKILSSINYYRFSAYWYPFRVKDTETGKITGRFREGTTFENILELYEFDRHLRLLIIDAIERIEVAVRTRVAYELAHAYGAFAHTNPANFHPNFSHADWLQKVEEETLRSSEEFINHYKSKYSGFPVLPIWMLTEIMTLGALSKLYRGMHHEDKKRVAAKFGLHHKQMADWLHVLTYVRNICTHHGRLWNRELAIKTQAPKAREWQPPLTPKNDRLFYVLLIIRFMLRQISMGDNWKRSCNELLEPIATNQLWRRAMGMPDNWKTHPLWR